MAHMYEEQVAVGRSDLANKAIEEYRLAIDADPTSEYLTSGLAELMPRPAVSRCGSRSAGYPQARSE